MKKNTAVKIGAGLVAAGAAAAAGYYFYGSKDAKTHRKIATKWAAGMKKDVLKEVKKLKVATPKEFAVVVDRAAKAYQQAHAVGASEMKQAVKELKANWEMVEREAKRTARKTKKAVAKRMK